MVSPVQLSLDQVAAKHSDLLAQFAQQVLDWEASGFSIDAFYSLSGLHGCSLLDYNLFSAMLAAFIMGRDAERNAINAQLQRDHRRGRPPKIPR